MEAVTTYHHFGLYAFLILSAGLCFIVWKWPEGKQYTFSQHVALYRHRIIYYILLFSLVLPLLLLFFVGWFVPHFQLSQWFSVCIIISAVAQYACTLIPETGGRKSLYHRALAGISAVMLAPPLVLLILSEAFGGLVKLVSAASLLAMLTIIGLIVAGKGQHSHFLYLQAGYFAAFFAATLAATYFVGG